MNAYPGYSEIPDWVWVPELLFATACLIAAALVLFATIRQRGTRRRVTFWLGFAALLGVATWVVTPVTVHVGADLITCATPTNQSFEQGYPNDAALSEVARVCRSEARAILAVQVAAVLAIGYGALVLGLRRPGTRSTSS